MSIFKGKKVLLGITGGIAAYKSAWLVRLFMKAGAKVQVVMTPGAKDFVTPLTLGTLSKKTVLTEFTKEDDPSTWNNHVKLGLWADFMVIAPATANTLSKMASGRVDNLLLTTYLSAKCPVYFAPAMDLDMYKHGSTKDSISKLQSFGNKLIPVGSGELASGLSGEGRMAEPEEILHFISEDLKKELPLLNKKVLITAGPTYEPIDPVRFIGNHSSGKMGYALAEMAAALGATVYLISGPTALSVEHEGIQLSKVTTAAEMFEQATKLFPQVDIAIAAAAVADYRPAQVTDQKIKKKDTKMSIALEPTVDILATLGASKENQYLVGFALETENEVENAKGKLHRKKLDLIVLNSLNDAGAGFQKNTNKVTLIDKNDKMETFPLKDKTDVATDIWNKIQLDLNA
ncbi:MAG: bifunctional phosphopantothenoylcysteine decarboxylase/phosphopantothenate--cysteine ligase CoaBC [Leeuwenhoekiella sp.]